MSFYTIQCAGFDVPQQDGIAAILNLAESALSDKWSLRDHMEANAVMINLDAANSQQLCAEQRQKRKPYQIILVANVQPAESYNNWFLLKKHNAPPSLRELTHLLNQVALCLAEEAKTGSTGAAEAWRAAGYMGEAQPQPAQATFEITTNEALESEEHDTGEEEVLEQQAASENNTVLGPGASHTSAALQEQVIASEDNTTPEAQSVTVSVEEAVSSGAAEMMDHSELDASISDSANAKSRKLHPKNFLFGLLMQAGKDNTCRILKLNRYPTLYIVPEDNLCYFSGTNEELSGYCTTARRLIQDKTISKSKLTKLLAGDPKTLPQSLAALNAYAVIQASQGRLLEGHAAEQPVKLTASPDSKAIPVLAQYADIAAYMLGGKYDLYAAAEALQTPIGKVFEFYNACFVLGYISAPATGSTTGVTVSTSSSEAQNKKTLKSFFAAFFKK